MEKRLPFTVYRVIIRGARVGRGCRGGRDASNIREMGGVQGAR